MVYVPSRTSTIPSGQTAAKMLDAPKLAISAEAVLGKFRGIRSHPMAPEIRATAFIRQFGVVALSPLRPGAASSAESWQTAREMRIELEKPVHNSPVRKKDVSPGF